MADIQMCLGKLKDGEKYLVCSKKEKCYRFMAEAGSYQAWGNPAPDFTEKKGCSSFWKIKKV